VARYDFYDLSEELYVFSIPEPWQGDISPQIRSNKNWQMFLIF
jgi:hypothetical protein